MADYCAFCRSTVALSTDDQVVHGRVLCGECFADWEAGAPVSPDTDDAAYYQHELGALADIERACAVETSN